VPGPLQGTVSRRWWREQTPVIRRGRILPDRRGSAQAGDLLVVDDVLVLQAEAAHLAAAAVEIRHGNCQTSEGDVVGVDVAAHHRAGACGRRV